MIKILFAFLYTLLALVIPGAINGEDSIRVDTSESQYTFHKLNPISGSYEVSSVVTLDTARQPETCQTFRFDSQGRLIKKSLYGNLSGYCSSPLIIDETGRPIKNGIERFSIHSTYDENGNLVDQYFSNYPKIINPDGLDCEIGPHYHAGQEASTKGFFSKTWNSFMETVFGKGFLQFAGYYEGTTATGIYNDGYNAHNKVRVSVINGILNIDSDMNTILTSLSSSHGDVTVHYVFRPTEGWTRDVWNCALVKMGFLSEPARQLGNLWKKLIAEMGGPQAGGIIQHYAHSIGATDTYNAIELLTHEERRMIHVVTIGSPSMIPNGIGFASVINYASKRDAICMIDILGYLRAWTTHDTNVVFVGSTYGVPEHSIYTESYQNVLKERGALFNQQHR